MRAMRPGRLTLVLAVTALALGIGWVPQASASLGFLPGSTGFDASLEQQGGSPATQAGSHPYTMKVSVALNASGELSDGDLRDLQLALPPGLLANPAAVNQCTQAEFHTPRISPYEESQSGESCPDATQVGLAAIHTSQGTRTFGLFNLAAPYGEAGAIGASPYGVDVAFGIGVREQDTALRLGLRNLSQELSISALELTLWGVPWDYFHDIERGNCLNEVDPASFFGEPSFYGGTPPTFHAGTCHVAVEATPAFLTLPSSCAAALDWGVSARSWQQPSALAEASAETPAVKGCVEPLSKAKVQLRTELASSPTGLVFNIDINDGGGFLNSGGIVRSPIQKATASLPEGLTINPSVGSGLGVCSEAEFAHESASSAPGAGCPNASKIGEVEIEGLLGLPEPVEGSLFVAQPYANPTHSLLALYIAAPDPRHGLFEKAIGAIEPDPRTGRLVATFEGLPQLHYTHFTLSLREGQRAVLLSPPECGDHITQLELRPYSDPTEVIHDASTLRITQGEGAAPCPSGSVRSFHPGLLAGSLNSQAGAYTPFHLRMTRTDSEQEITSYSATFPEGLLAKVAGVGECSDTAIEAAKHRSGAEELANPSCPESSKIGRTMAGYGVGGVLAWAPGNLYLAGPYHGSQLSVVAIDSALIGPFDLGVVVVRTAVRIDPHTAQASIDAAGSDPIPHIIAGIPIHVRDIRVYVDRPSFALNGTSCDPIATVSSLGGSGADPFSATDDTTASSRDRFQLFNCSALRFRPRFAISLRGPTRRSRYPSFKAVVKARPGDANIGAASVTLPPSLFLAQEHLHSICTNAQFARDACPPASVYGHARASTPLLDQPLEGPVIVRSSSNQVPDLVVVLRGRGVEIELDGRIDSSRGGLRGTFEGLPDAPLDKFVMTLPGGKRGLLVNAEDLCASPQRANARFIGQSNATEVLHPRLRVKCPKKRRAEGATASELAQKGHLRVRFDAKVAPKTLPRTGTAPISVSLGGKVSTTDGSQPPALRRFQVAINRSGRLDTKGLAVCRREDIQPATTANALAACGSAKVGEGSFEANVVIPEQSPFPSKGKMIAFNGVQKGKPVIFAHVYGTDPIPTSFTLPLKISHAKGRFGTVLSASLPNVTSDVAFVTGISLTLGRKFSHRGKRHSYLSAGCPAPKGFPGVLYPLARTSFSFAGGTTLSQTLTRNCKVR